MPMRPRTPFAALPQCVCYLCLYLYLIYLGQASISIYLTQQQYKQQQRQQLEQQQQIQPNILGCEIAFRFIFICLPSCEHCDKLVLTFFFLPALLLFTVVVVVFLFLPTWQIFIRFLSASHAIEQIVRFSVKRGQ